MVLLLFEVRRKEVSSLSSLLLPSSPSETNWKVCRSRQERERAGTVRKEKGKGWGVFNMFSWIIF
jgi:hypothetical protein